MEGLALREGGGLFQRPSVPETSGRGTENPYEEWSKGRGRFECYRERRGGWWGVARVGVELLFGDVRVFLVFLVFIALAAGAGRTEVAPAHGT